MFWCTSGGIGHKKNRTGVRSLSLPIRQPARLGKRCQLGLLGLGFAVRLVGLGFPSKKKYYNSYNTFTCIPIIIFYRENLEWVDGTLDDIPNWETHTLNTSKFLLPTGIINRFIPKEGVVPP